MRDRVRRHRLRLVPVGDGNLGGLSTNNTDDERICFAGAHTPANDRFRSRGSRSRATYTSASRADDDDERAIITGDSADRPRRGTSVGCHCERGVRDVA